MSSRFLSDIPVWLAWAVMTSLGSAAGFAIIWGLRDLFPWDTYGLFGLVGLIFVSGALIGFGQWLILRRRFRTVWLWIPATAVVFPVGFFAGALVVPFFVPAAWALNVPRTGLALAGIAWFCIPGLFLGVFQWLCLRRGLGGMWKWILASILSWGLGISVPWYVIVTYTSSDAYTSAALFVGLGFFIGIIAGAISGAFVSNVVFTAAHRVNADPTTAPSRG
jgi:hypothetical protein